MSCDSLALPTSLSPSTVVPTKVYLPSGNRFLNFSRGTSSNGGSLVSEKSSVKPHPFRRPSVRSGDRHRPPRLAVEEELRACVAGGGVDLDDHRRRIERNRLRFRLARLIAGKRRAAQGEQRERSEAGRDVSGTSLHVASFRSLAVRQRE